MRRRRFAPVLAWSVVALLAISSVVTAFGTLRGDVGAATPAEVAWLVLALVYGVVGALIVTRRPGNVIGWLLMSPGVTAQIGIFAAPLDTAPTVVTPWVVVQLWYDNISWMFLIFPVMLILSLFPDGRPPSPRWRWQPAMIGAMTAILILIAALSRDLGPLEGDWTVRNPIGVLPIAAESAFWTWFDPIWTGLLLVVTVGGIAAMVARYRRSGWVERQQIKWLLYAVSVFGVAFATAAVTVERYRESITDLLLIPSLALIPLAIAVAILRHRLFDIDVIIRRTVVYVIVMGVLALVFAGSVLVVQSAARRLTGQDSTLAVAASTLFAAALFNPLRRRVARTVGRRFFRGDYDLEAVVYGFAGRARSETDIDILTHDLAAAVADTLHPSSVAVTLVGRPARGAS